MAHNQKQQNVRRQRRTEHTSTRPVPIDNAWGGWNQPQDYSAWFQEPTPEEEPWDLRQLEQMDHVDMVSELVQWWIRGVRAAEKGIILKMEDFLEEMEARHRTGQWNEEVPEENVDNPWRPRDVQEEAAAWMDGVKEHYDEFDESRRPIGYAGQQWDESADEDPEWKMACDEAERSSPWRNSDRTKSDEAAALDGRDHWPKEGQDGSVASPRPESLNEQESWRFVEAVARRRAADVRRKKDMHNFFQMPTEDKLRNIQQVIRDLQSH
ncbi:hypothetical protein NEOLEDRAFT_28812 [Neolentinus lepideus HHB14362 ss-1]|uniref:Uncharacterized protein n=1 Tax=Neolentinus lepideus HHB14362 ss-1 TaxID=1314782 RepID=A0A165W5Q8_9AGAM|nr:hypothetical protein NEOLEDRAFT_28812 [Neolentinus lepideus HHB14362 ss-1]